MLRFIFLTGKNGIGKSTQAKLLRDSSPSLIIETGDLYEEAKNPNHRYHYLIAPFINSVDGGRLVPDENIFEIVKQEIARGMGEGYSNFIFTGFPRTDPQVDLLDQFLQEVGKEQQLETRFLYFVGSDELSKERILGRKEENLKRGEKVKIWDNDLAKMERRLKVFKEQTRPMLKRLFKEGRLNVIKGFKDQKTVFRASKEAIS